MGKANFLLDDTVNIFALEIWLFLKIVSVTLFTCLCELN